MKDKNLEEARQAIKEHLEEIEIKLIDAYLKGKQNGLELAQEIYNEK